MGSVSMSTDWKHTPIHAPIHAPMYASAHHVGMSGYALLERGKAIKGGECGLSSAQPSLSPTSPHPNLHYRLHMIGHAQVCCLMQLTLYCADDDTALRKLCNLVCLHRKFKITFNQILLETIFQCYTYSNLSQHQYSHVCKLPT